MTAVEADMMLTAGGTLLVNGDVVIQGCTVVAFAIAAPVIVIVIVGAKSVVTAVAVRIEDRCEVDIVVVVDVWYSCYLLVEIVVDIFDAEKRVVLQ